MKDYYFYIKPDGSMVWRGSGHGPCVYHSEAQAKKWFPIQASGREEVKILHLSMIGQTVMSTGWIQP